MGGSARDAENIKEDGGWNDVNIELMYEILKNVKELNKIKLSKMGKTETT